jgi:endonuclease/exonuclease/phosphatase family metal-dependent hydrolase
MKLKVLFWNVWLENQLKGPEKTDLLFKELESIIKKYQPDCIGLNEVLKHFSHDTPLINSWLHKLGYVHTYFSNGSPLSSKWTIGSALCSKYELKDIQEIELGKNETAKKRGHGDHKVKAITAKIVISNKTKIGFIVAHPINLKPSTITDHFRHTKKLSDFVLNSDYRLNSIIGGDFNEPMHFPKSFKSRTDKHFHHKTGSKRSPTWRHNNWKITPLRANLDRLFWSKDGFLEIDHFEIIESNVSDHKPIYASFRIKI